MSVMMLSDTHLSALATAAIEYQAYVWKNGSPDTARAIGRARIVELLHATNAAAFRARYPQHAAELDGSQPVAHAVALPSPVHVLKWCQCYAYQAGEAPGWEQSDARRTVESITAAAIARLPGYDVIQWSLDDAPAPTPPPAPRRRRRPPAIAAPYCD